MPAFKVGTSRLGGTDELNAGIGYQAASSSTSAVPVTSLTFAHTVPEHSRRLLVVGVGLVNSAGQTVTGITYGGVALTKLDAVANGIATRSELWYLSAPAVGAANVVVSLSAAGALAAGAVSYSGTTQGSPFRASTTNTGTGTTISTSLGSQADDLVIDSLASATTGPTVGAGQTQRWSDGFATLVSTGSDEAGAASVAMSWTTVLSAAWAHVVAGIAVFAPIPATLAAPLGGLVASLSATPKVVATLAAPLGGLTATITATPKVNATLSAPLGGLTAVAAAKATVPATLAAPLGGLSASVAATPKVVGTMSAPLGGLTATATAAPKVVATLVAPLGALVGTVVATPKVVATLAAPLGPLTSTASAIPKVSAVLVASLGGLNSTAAAVPKVNATLSAPLGGLTATISAIPKVNASLTAPLGSITATATATPTALATLTSLLGALTATLSATPTVNASLTAHLGPLVVTMLAVVHAVFGRMTATVDHAHLTSSTATAGTMASRVEGDG